MIKNVSRPVGVFYFTCASRKISNKMQTATVNSITLKCSNCGANLEITLEMETFACGYCGASQIVTRSGGTVSLRLLNESINRVQAGTDKTAAELAIRRLKEEYQVVLDTIKRSQTIEAAEKAEINKFYKQILIAPTFLGLLLAANGGLVAAIAVVLWIGAAFLIAYFYNEKNSFHSEIYTKKYNRLTKQAEEILKLIDVNKKIVA